jgi:tetratricopeptide (TPR) repeat protein
MRTMRMRWLLLPLVAGALGGCTLFGSTPPHGSPAEPPATGTAAQPGPGEAPSAPPPQRTFRLSHAASALVSQARRQSGAGDYDQAAATLERALRIEPDNPLVWIELGRVRLAERDGAQADALGRKALTLAAGDLAAQASGWHLIADSLRVRGRNQEAEDAERRAGSLATR